MGNLLKKHYVRQLWSLGWPSGIPRAALCKDVFFRWLLNYFLNFPRFFIVRSDLWKGFWSRSFFSLLIKWEGKNVWIFFQERNDFLLWWIMWRKGPNIIYFLLSLLNSTNFSLCIMSYVLWFELVAWPAEYSHCTGKMLTWSSCKKK